MVVVLPFVAETSATRRPGASSASASGAMRVDHPPADRRARAAPGDARQPSGGLAGRDRGARAQPRSARVGHRRSHQYASTRSGSRVSSRPTRLGVGRRGSRGPRRASRPASSGGATAMWLTSRNALDDAVDVSSAARGGTCASCSGREPAVLRRSRRPPSRVTSAPRCHASRPGSAIDRWIRSIQAPSGPTRSRSSPSRPPGRSARWSSGGAAAASNQWNAWATVTASSAPSANGQRLGDRGRRPARRGSSRCSTVRMPAHRLDRDERRRRCGTSSRVSLPVPAARSQTVAPGRDAAGARPATPPRRAGTTAGPARRPRPRSPNPRGGDVVDRPSSGDVAQRRPAV